MICRVEVENQNPENPDNKINMKDRCLKMTREEFNTKSVELLGAVSAEKPDTGKISEMVEEMREGFNKEVTRAETAETNAADLKTKNESLQAANMNLFLKSGQLIKETEEKKIEKPQEKIDFDSLFDEKGELK